MRKASIVIPTRNRLDLLERCVDSIRRHTAQPHEIIVVDNGSSDGTAEWCRREGIALAALCRNEGFPVACNIGLHVATGETLVLLNNDTVVPEGWLDRMSAALYSAPDVGIVGPITNYASGCQQIEDASGEVGELMKQAASLSLTAGAEHWQPTKRLVGFCFIFKRELLDRIGALDERFSPGHFEDDDYCLRARNSGFRLLVCRDTLVYHEGSASFKREGGTDNQRLLVERNYRLFVDKWRVDPRAFI